MHWTEIAERRAAAAAGTGDVAIFDLHGQMTLSGEEEPRLLLAIRAAVQNGARHVPLTLPHVSSVDSTGLGENVGAYTRAARHGGSLNLVGVSPRIDELLDTTNIDTVIPSFPDEASALRAFDAGA